MLFPVPASKQLRSLPAANEQKRSANNESSTIKMGNNKKKYIKEQKCYLLVFVNSVILYIEINIQDNNEHREYGIISSVSFCFQIYASCFTGKHIL